MARLELNFTRKSKVQAQGNTMMVFALILTPSHSGLEKKDLKRCKKAWVQVHTLLKEQTG